MKTSNSRARPERRAVSVWLPRFATDLRVRRWAAASGGTVSPAAAERRKGPLVIVAEANGQAILAAVDRAAAAAGLTLGLPLTDARALEPRLQTAPADPAGDNRALIALASWCGRYTPWTAPDTDGRTGGTGGIWLEITGAAHLFGGEAALLEDLGTRLTALGYAHRLAVAATPGAAWAAARFAPPAAGAAIVIASGIEATERAIAQFPVTALRIAPETAEGLHRLGLRRIGQLAGQPRAPLARRFGAGLLRRLDQAVGREHEPVTPCRPPPRHQSRLAFAEPLLTQSAVAAALEPLLAVLCERMAAAAVGARRLRLSGYRVGGDVAEIDVGTGRPGRDAVHLERLFVEKLERFDPGFGIDALILAAIEVDPLSPAQAALNDDSDDAGMSAEALTQLLDRLANRLGANRVLSLMPVPRHPPEHAQRAVSALGTPLSAPMPSAFVQARPAAPRPLQLLATPERIEAMAPLPDRPPVMFRWRRRQYRVALADGPERIAPEWWLEDPAELFNDSERLRDYYRVEDAEGRRFWLFRAGLYRPDRPPKWYMHGIFA